MNLITAKGSPPHRMYGNASQLKQVSRKTPTSPNPIKLTGTLLENNILLTRQCYRNSSPSSGPKETRIKENNNHGERHFAWTHSQINSQLKESWGTLQKPRIPSLGMPSDKDKERGEVEGNSHIEQLVAPSLTQEKEGQNLELRIPTVKSWLAYPIFIP